MALQAIAQSHEYRCPTYSTECNTDQGIADMIQDRSNLVNQLYQAWSFEKDYHKHCPNPRDTLLTIRRNDSPEVQAHMQGPLWNFYRVLFIYCVETSLVLQAIAVVIICNGSNTIPQEPDHKTLISLAVCQVLQAMVLAAVLKHTFHMILHGIPSMKRIGQTYIAVIIAFSGFHLLAFTFHPHSYHIDINPVTLGQSIISLVYYSVATISSTGFGDVYALEWPGQTLAALQMSIGTSYNIGIFAILCSHFQKAFDLEEVQLRRQHARMNRNVLQRLFKQMRENVPGLERCRKFLIRHLAAFVITTSLISLIIIKLVIGDETNLTSPSSQTTLYALAIIGLIQAIVVISMSVRVVHKINVNYIHFSFLLQSVIATVVIFAHFYLLLSLIQGPSAFRISSLDGTPGVHYSLERRAWTLLFFSTVVQSTTGYGDVWAISSCARVLVTLHMLISTLYAVAVVGLGISRIMSPESQPASAQEPSIYDRYAPPTGYQVLVDNSSELLV